MIRQFDNLAYYMISVDTLEDNKGFAEKEKADFSLLADPTKETAKKYGVLNDQSGLARRWTFYIGPDGKILFIDKAVKPQVAGETVVAKLQELGIKKKGS